MSYLAKSGGLGVCAHCHSVLTTLTDTQRTTYGVEFHFTCHRGHPNIQLVGWLSVWQAFRVWGYTITHRQNHGNQAWCVLHQMRAQTPRVLDWEGTGRRWPYSPSFRTPTLHRQHLLRGLAHHHCVAVPYPLSRWRWLSHRTGRKGKQRPTATAEVSSAPQSVRRSQSRVISHLNQLALWFHPLVSVFIKMNKPQLNRRIRLILDQPSVPFAARDIIHQRFKDDDFIDWIKATPLHKNIIKQLVRLKGNCN